MIAIVLGTRPEIIKLSPVIRRLVRDGTPFYIIHTGQHYSHNLDHLFFESLGLPEPKYHLSVGSGSHGAQTAGMIQGIEKVLLTDKPDVVLVQGDTNGVLAAAIVCAKFSDIQLGHVEAGLRSYDLDDRKHYCGCCPGESSPRVCEVLNTLPVARRTEVIFSSDDPSARKRRGRQSIARTV